MNEEQKIINGLKFNINVMGDKEKPKLFFIHGNMDQGKTFKRLCEKLIDRFYCICPDLRGFGKSEYSNNPLGYFYYEHLSDLHSIFTEFSPDEKISIIGHSSGGNLTCLYAGVYPERVKNIVSIEGFGIDSVSYNDAGLRIREWIDSSCSGEPKKVNFKRYAKRLASKYDLEDVVAEEWANSLVYEINNEYFLRADPKHFMKSPYLYRFEGVLPIWKNISAKTLLIYSESSDFNGCFSFSNKEELMEKVFERIKAFPKSSSVIKLEKFGHMLHLQCPEIIASYLKRHLC